MLLNKKSEIICFFFSKSSGIICFIFRNSVQCCVCSVIIFSGRIEPKEAFLAVGLRLLCTICSNYVVDIVLMPLFLYAGRYICFI